MNFLKVENLSAIHNLEEKNGIYIYIAAVTVKRSDFVIAIVIMV